jgi:hypothetical protein
MGSHCVAAPWRRQQLTKKFEEFPAIVRKLWRIWFAGAATIETPAMLQIRTPCEASAAARVLI